MSADPPTREYGEPGSTFIQWKGTEVCMDVVCLCGEGFHLDVDFAYAARCPYCQRVLVFGTQVSVVDGALTGYTGEIKDPEKDIES